VLTALTRRQWTLGAGSGAVGCGRRRGAPDANSITVLYPADESALGPDGWPARFLVFLPLVAWNRHGELEGRLAQSWEHSPDYRAWKIRLRDGVRWHDGVPVTAHDVKFTIELFRASTPASFQLEIIDDLTYSLTCVEKALWGTPLDDWTVYYPKHLLERNPPNDFYSWDFWTRPIGNGPYRHVGTVPGTMMQFEVNADYAWDKPRIERVVLKLAGDSKATGIPELVSGGVDAVADPSRIDVQTLARDSRFRTYNHVYNDLMNVLFWNHRNELFRDPNVRRALTLAIDRRELLQVLNFPADTPLVDSLFSSRQLRRRDLPEPIPHDPALAGRLLDAAGWDKRNSDGLRERDGRPFTFTALNASDRSDPRAGVYVQAQLRRLGIKVNLDTRGGTFQRVIAGDYQAAFHIMFTDWTPDTGPFGNGAPRFLHAAGYRSSRLEELASELRSAFDPDREDQLYLELAKLFREDVPATFLYPDVYTTVASARVRGMENSPYRGDPTWCMDQLFLEKQG
jgi:peptide/nickel transport system substrate-binding protein